MQLIKPVPLSARQTCVFVVRLHYMKGQVKTEICRGCCCQRRCVAILKLYFSKTQTTHNLKHLKESKSEIMTVSCTS